MSKGHRPFWVLKHLITGETRSVDKPDCEDGMWRIVLSDGSSLGLTEEAQDNEKARRRSRKGKRNTY